MDGKRITIVGGGLAGLTLGIGLRRREVPVTVWEAGHYPRHRVCGEFISGRGQEALRRLGLEAIVLEAGAIPASTTAFFSPRRAAPAREMTVPAWSISRYELDAALAREFRQAGGELREGEKWRSEEAADGTVRASGRRAVPVAGGWRWFGLKVHARNVELGADLEMHLGANEYVGMSRLKRGEVNICGLFRRPAAGAEAKMNWREMFRGLEGSHRWRRLEHADFDEDSFCSVAGLSLEPKRAAHSVECCVGDAITMIPPVTGNGMSMAFESAELAVAPLAEYSAGSISWSTAKATIARECDRAFARRLAWSGVLQRCLFQPRLQSALVTWVPRWPWLWRWLVAKTR